MFDAVRCPYCAISGLRGAPANGSGENHLGPSRTVPCATGSAHFDEEVEFESHRGYNLRVAPTYDPAKGAAQPHGKQEGIAAYGVRGRQHAPVEVAQEGLGTKCCGRSVSRRDALLAARHLPLSAAIGESRPETCELPLSFESCAIVSARPGEDGIAAHRFRP